MIEALLQITDIAALQAEVRALLDGIYLAWWQKKKKEKAKKDF